jgi:hypothetical protein
MSKSRIFFVILILGLFSAFVFAQTTDQITIVTYYPSPYGIYKFLKSHYLELVADFGVTQCSGRWMEAINFNTGASPAFFVNGGLLQGFDRASRSFNWEYQCSMAMWLDARNGDLYVNRDIYAGNMVFVNGEPITPVMYAIPISGSTTPCDTGDHVIATIHSSGVAGFMGTDSSTGIQPPTSGWIVCGNIEDYP